MIRAHSSWSRLMYNRAKINLKDFLYLCASTCKPYLVFNYRRPAEMYFQYKPCKWRWNRGQVLSSNFVWTHENHPGKRCLQFDSPEKIQMSKYMFRYLKQTYLVCLQNLEFLYKMFQPNDQLASLFSVFLTRIYIDWPPYETSRIQDT